MADACAAAHRLHRSRAKLDVHAGRRAAAPAAATPLGREPVGPARTRSASMRRNARWIPSRCPSARTSARAWTRASQSNGIGPEAPVIVMHVSAGNPFRRWPVDRFAAVAARLVQDDPSRFVVLTSGPSEAGAADEAAREAQQQLPSGLASRIARCGEFDLAGPACAGRARRALHRRRQRAAAHCRNHAGAGRRAVWPDAARALGALAGSADSVPRRSSGRTSRAGRATSADACTRDFRCLTSLTAASVVAAAERAMSRSSLTERPGQPGRPGNFRA